MAVRQSPYRIPVRANALKLRGMIRKIPPVPAGVGVLGRIRINGQDASAVVPFRGKNDRDWNSHTLLRGCRLGCPAEPFTVTALPGVKDAEQVPLAIAPSTIRAYAPPHLPEIDYPGEGRGGRRSPGATGEFGVAHVFHANEIFVVFAIGGAFKLGTVVPDLEARNCKDPPRNRQPGTHQDEGQDSSHLFGYLLME
jgi:hypothetical protein